MLGNGRLGDGKLFLNDLSDRAGQLITVGQTFEYAPSNGISQYIECVHQGVSEASPV